MAQRHLVALQETLPERMQRALGIDKAAPLWLMQLPLSV